MQIIISSGVLAKELIKPKEREKFDIVKLLVKEKEQNLREDKKNYQNPIKYSGTGKKEHIAVLEVIRNIVQKQHSL